MAEITLSTGATQTNVLQTIGHAVSEFFARHGWQRFQQEAAPLSDRLLSDIGLDRVAMASSATAREFMERNAGFIARHDLG